MTVLPASSAPSARVEIRLSNAAEAMAVAWFIDSVGTRTRSAARTRAGESTHLPGGMTSEAPFCLTLSSPIIRLAAWVSTAVTLWPAWLSMDTASSPSCCPADAPENRTSTCLRLGWACSAAST